MDKGSETADEAVRRRGEFYIIRRVVVAGVREKGHEREDDNAKIDLSSRNRVAKLRTPRRDGRRNGERHRVFVICADKMSHSAASTSLGKVFAFHKDKFETSKERQQ